MQGGVMIPVMLLLIGQVSINTGSPEYYNAAWYYRDLVKSAQYWPLVEGSFYDPQKLGYQIDDSGWPKGLDKTQQIAFQLGQSPGGDPPGGDLSQKANLPAGTYTFSLEGKGSIQVLAGYKGGRFFQQNFDIKGPTSIPIVLEDSVFPQIMIYILASEKSDYIRNLHFHMPGYAPTDKYIYNDLFIKDMSKFRVIRCMNFAATNNSKVSTWDDRSKEYTVSAKINKGIPWEEYGNSLKGLRPIYGSTYPTKQRTTISIMSSKYFLRLSRAVQSSMSNSATKHGISASTKLTTCRMLAVLSILLSRS
jgi:hypothetical protein